MIERIPRHSLQSPRAPPHPHHPLRPLTSALPRPLHRLAHGPQPPHRHLAQKTKTDLYQEFITSSRYSFFTIRNNQIELGHWRDPKLLSLIRQNSLLKGASPVQFRLTMAQLGIAGPGLPLSFSYPQPIDQYVANSARFFLPDGFHTGPNPRDPWPTDPTNTWSHAGISIQRESSGQLLIHRLILPIWLPLLLLAIPPLLRLRSAYRNYRRRRSNLCPSCGYDLRATPNLCPECGHTTDAALSQ
jgi:hypothetical protein